MTAPIPVRTTQEVLREVEAASTELRRFMSPDDPRLASWEHRADKAFIKFPEESLLCYAVLAHFQGDVEETERFLDKAEKNRLSRQAADHTRLTLFGNLLCASKALAVALRAVNVKAGNITTFLKQTVANGAVHHVKSLLEQAAKAKLDLRNIDQIEAIEQIAAGLTDGNFTDEDFAAAIDAAGEVMRGRKLFWLEGSPHLIFDPISSCMGLRYKVDVSPQDAARMNFELTDLLIRRELDHVPITLGFIGVATE